MEDPKPPQRTLLNDPHTKKPVDSISHYENSKYFQMRAVLNDIRPNFIEVLRTPDFRNCDEATEIQQKLKVFVDLYKEMTSETFTLEKCKTELKTEQAQPDKLRRSKSPTTQEDLPVFVAPPTTTTSENQRSDMQGTYVVGGSAFGWNFITFPGNVAVYYGRTREAFRSANVVSRPPN